MKLTTIGTDLAKNVMQVHGDDENGKAVLKKQLRRAQLLPFFADLTPCRIARKPAAVRTTRPGNSKPWAIRLDHGSHLVWC